MRDLACRRVKGRRKMRKTSGLIYSSASGGLSGRILFRHHAIALEYYALSDYERRGSYVAQNLARPPQFNPALGVYDAPYLAGYHDCVYVQDGFHQGALPDDESAVAFGFALKLAVYPHSAVENQFSFDTHAFSYKRYYLAYAGGFFFYRFSEHGFPFIVLSFPQFPA